MTEDRETQHSTVAPTVKLSVYAAGRLAILLVMAVPSHVFGNVTRPENEETKIYDYDFESATIGAAPSDFFVLDGEFNTAEIDGNRVLRLSGTPLRTYGILVGPAGAGELRIRASVYSASSGRRQPSFGVGLFGISGYRLRLTPSARRLELLLNDQVLQSVSYNWTSERWTILEMRTARAGDSEWRIQGKCWEDGGDEPESWMIDFATSEGLGPGRASLWGIPYSGKDILFDHIQIWKRIRDQSIPEDVP